MKIFKINLSLLFFIIGISCLSAQQAVISPIPQSLEWGSKAFDNTVSFKINGEATADKDAVNLLKERLSIKTTGVKLIIGKKGDTNVSSYASLIPDKTEGYYLEIASDKVIIAGHDSIGTYYGVQTLLQIMKSPEVMSVKIEDFPDVLERGVIEGFYGNPFSTEDRKSQFDFYGENKMNVYIYGPKDDPYHGFSNRWRDPYPPADAKKLKELVENAHKNKVNFVWAVHPGRDIKWDDKNGDGVIDDFKAAVRKFEMMYNLGVRSFAVFFDDIGGEGTNPRNQAKMLNYITKEFVNKKPDVAPLILCPTQYNQAWSGGDYLNILGTEMDKSVRIMWTGKSVVRMIDKETMDWINQRIKRKAYIWLNYPVTDYVVDHILMGPVVGNGKDIAPQLSGFTANPMEYAEASKVALFGIADYTWNMKKFNPTTSWINGLRYLQPDNFEAFKIFCENNVDLGPTFHGLRMPGESKPFITVATPFMNNYKSGNYSEDWANKLAEQFKSFSDAAHELEKSTYNVRMINEIKPWLKVFDIIGQKGQLLANMYKSLNDKDSVGFVRDYLKIDSLRKAQKKVISRDFPGSIKSPNPKPANEVVEPFIKKLKSMLVMDYRRQFSYRLDVFPKILLEEGRYYIKIDGKYLTNTNVNGTGGNPQFVAYRDTINPQRQEWTITIDPNTERYKIVNTQDNRYVNELGNFGTNKYDAAWNTYFMYRFNGKYAIQNAGSAGDKFWEAKSDRISPSSEKTLTVDRFIFEILPVGADSIVYSMLEADDTYYVKSNELYLTNTNIQGRGGVPTFKAFEKDADNKAQLWSFQVDNVTKRMKMTSAADNRYVNEKGEFGTNPYYSDWNTYVMHEIDGVFSIRNAGEAGQQYWFVEDNRIKNKNMWGTEGHLFEIVSSNSSTSIGNYPFVNQFSVIVKDHSIQVTGGVVSALTLYNMTGQQLLKSEKSDRLTFGQDIPQGIYLLQVESMAKGGAEVHKIILR